MEEKERYVIRYDLDYILCLIDTEGNKGVGDYIQIVKLLNRQDKRIKELNTKIVEEMELSAQRREIIEQLTIENRELKEQLHDLPKKIVKDISKELKSLYKNYPIIYSEDKDIVKSCYDKDSVNKILGTILKKYGDGK